VETGPIRPPASRQSLHKVSRNCPWNRCKFCPVYKGQRFSRRPLQHVLRDIDLVADAAESLGPTRPAAREDVGGYQGAGTGPAWTGRARTGGRGRAGPGAQTARSDGARDGPALAGGRRQDVFLQDANALGVPYEESCRS